MAQRSPRDRTNRQRLAACTVALGLLVSILSLQTAPAVGADPDRLQHRKSEVSQNLREARGELSHSSTRLLKAVEALEAAEAELSSARRKLQRARSQLAVAVERDRRMQARLDAAKERLRDARAKLAEGRGEVKEQRDEVAAWAASSFQDSGQDMLGLRVLLSAESPESLTTQMDAVDSINAKNADRFDRLQATEVLLKVDRDEVRAAKEQVARKRKAAAENLALRKELTKQAEQARDTVASMVDRRSAAMRAAERAKAADRRQIAQLESERGRIEDQLREIAERRAAERRRQTQTSRAGGRAGGFLSYPVNSYVTSPYGQRFHPILHYWKLHDGTDFGAGCGTPIRAAADGRVLQLYYNAGYGNRVIIDHGVQRGVSLSTSYNHLSGYSAFPGQRVERGEIIGFGGTTGYSTGCHLHFMVYENGVTADPMGWL